MIMRSPAGGKVERSAGRMSREPKIYRCALSLSAMSPDVSPITSGSAGSRTSNGPPATAA